MASIVSNDDISIKPTTFSKVMVPSINIRRSIVDGEDVAIKVGNFEEAGVITLFGDYPQNSVDIPKFDLSKVSTLPDDVANFKFILSIKDGEDDEPTLYASDTVTKELLRKYGNEEPIPVNYLLNERKIVFVNIKPLKELIQRMREAELSINLNRKEINGQIEVSKNLFSYSNYKTSDVGSLEANPTYDLKELVKYISWVVAKPNPNYDDRLIPANELGEWNGSKPEEPDTDEPSIETTNTPPTQPTLYPPIGRKGTTDAEEVLSNGVIWVWNVIKDKWQTENERYDINGRDRDDDSFDEVGGRS